MPAASLTNSANKSKNPFIEISTRYSSSKNIPIMININSITGIEYREWGCIVLLITGETYEASDTYQSIKSQLGKYYD